MNTARAPYRSPFEAVRDVKTLVKIWLERHLLLYSDRYVKPEREYSDLYVDRTEVTAFLGGRLGAGADREDELARLSGDEEYLRQRMVARAARTVEDGLPMPIEALRAAFAIEDERLLDLILALLVVEVDPEFIRAYSHAWCDFTRKHVEVGFAIELVSGADEEAAETLCRFFLDGDHRLLRFGVLETFSPAGHADLPLMQQGIRLSRRVARFLSGRLAPPAEIVGVRGGLVRPERPLASVLVPDALRTQLTATFDAAVRGDRGASRLLLHGPEGVGKRSLCGALATHRSLPLLVADCAELPVTTSACEARILGFLCESLLQGAVPVLTRAEMLWRPSPEPGREDLSQLVAIEAACARFDGPLLLTAQQRVPALTAYLPGLVEIPIPHPSREAQRAIWADALPDNVRLSEGFEVEDIVKRYSLTGGSIHRVAKTIAFAARRAGKSTLDPGDVLPVVRDLLGHQLGSVAVPVDRGHEWADLVLPDRTVASLQELVSFVHYREQIVHEWGFGEKVRYGRGVSALFHGLPGTGKTMAASIIATDLGMEIFQIDLSRIVDKYIGETEKNLARVFEEGSRAQAILLFDEADSLFARRTGVSSSTDRYANLEVNFLLQRIEQYEGISILTTNLPDSLDEGFMRRIRFKVEFPFPTVEERERLWRSMIPRRAPVDDDTSFVELARRFELSGAHIKNVVLRAAAIAAQEQSTLNEDVFVRAANREYADMGKLVREEDLL